jgi:hypothetical protein
MNEDYFRKIAMQRASQLQAQMRSNIYYQSGLLNLLGQGGQGQNLSQPGMPSHLGAVKEFRKNFKQYTKEEFRHISNTPIVKNILMGMTELNKDQIKDRIKEHLDNL